MKKILFVLPSLSIGGLEKVQVTVANMLSEKGYDVTVLSFDKGFDLVNDLNSNVKFIYKKPKYEFLKKIPKIKYYFDDGLWETRTSPKHLYKYYVGKQKYDIEIAFFRGRSVKIISGSDNKKSLKIAWVHNDYKKCTYTANFKNIDECKKAYCYFDKIVCVSNDAAKSFEEVIGYKNKIQTIYNPLPINDIIKNAGEECPLKKKKFTLVSVGRLNYQKGFDNLLKAVKNLNRKGLDFDLWIIGSGNEENNLKKMKTDNRLNNVKFLGQQKNPYNYMKQADLYVCSSRFEGYNLTVAEALILGIPVLSTKCTGPCEILDYGKYGVICENSIEGLTEKLYNLITHEKLLDTYRKKTKSRKNFFDEKLILKRIENLWDEKNSFSNLD